MDQILRNEDASISDAAHRLKYIQWYSDLDLIVSAYDRESDPTRKERLAKAYGMITGDDIEDRLYYLHRLRD